MCVSNSIVKAVIAVMKEGANSTLSCICLAASQPHVSAFTDAWGVL